VVPYKVEQVCLNDCPPTVPVVVVVPYSVELVDLTFTPLIVPEQVVVPYSVEQLYPAYADGEVARIPALEIIDANKKFKDFILKNVD